MAISVTTIASETPIQVSTVEREVVSASDAAFISAEQGCGRCRDRHQTARLSMHATWCGLPGSPSKRTSSSAPLHASIEIAQRGWNAQPVGGDSGLAGSPGSTP